MQFKRLKGRMGYRKLYRYLINRDVMVSLSQVRQALCQAGLKSKVVTYYKKRKQEHPTFPNVLERSFQPGKKDVPTVLVQKHWNMKKRVLVQSLKNINAFTKYSYRLRNSESLL
ncbi:hypothetical protein ABE42_41585 [Bacillus thuringiensis]|uniref:hypothetical protein n=1 Tax=Bacillus thuringiensis TaxID=1428 RepID=UPI001F556D93|nr:hypothetical protein [Bacillus thuringiensis]MBG9541073.1 hypothetical protein [Bacillus thuringiensis]MBG9585518.1 hypothetical protein [Bacillus thuringiensis]